MRNLERRVVALESNPAPNEMSRLLDRLSRPDLERLEQIVIAHDAGEWSDVSELAEDDLRILASIGVVGADE